MGKSGILYVEGKDDLHVFSALAGIYDIPETFIIKDVEGIGNLFDTFSRALKTAHYKGKIYDGSSWNNVDFDIERLGIVVDANNDISERWNSISKILEEKGYSIINEMDINGILIKDEKKDVPYVGIWIMPDNIKNGMLEDFFRDFIPENEKLISKVNLCIDEVSDDKELPTPKPRSKAEIRTWLAWQEKSESRMGYALSDKKDHLNIHNENTEKFIDWIKRLFQS